jgi:hypothetical protein
MSKIDKGETMSDTRYYHTSGNEWLRKVTSKFVYIINLKPYSASMVKGWSLDSVPMSYALSLPEITRAEAVALLKAAGLDVDETREAQGEKPQVDKDRIIEELATALQDMLDAIDEPNKCHCAPGKPNCLECKARAAIAKSQGSTR